MTHNAQQDLLNELDQLLDREREALLTGKLDEMSRSLTLKEDLIERLNAAGGDDQDRLADVQDKLTRNQHLMSGALDGIRAVADRMAALRQVRQGLQTYDQAGRRAQLTTPSDSSVEKRA